VLPDGQNLRRSAPQGGCAKQEVPAWMT